MCIFFLSVFLCCCHVATAAAMVAAPAVKRVVVIGAGWGGLSCAHHLSRQGCDVTVVDAAERPGGLVSDSWLTPGGRRAEAGDEARVRGLGR